MDTKSQKEPLASPLERILAILAAAACLVITIAVWRSVSPNQPMWLLPGLYFVELPAVTILSALAFLFPVPASPQIAWATAGICGAFALLGLFSVGFFYVPISLIYLLLGVLAASRRQIPFMAGFVPFLAAAVAQAAFMFLALRVLVSAP